QSMLKLGRAQGVAIAAAIQAKLPVFEYAPKKVKQSITGNGNASKDQVFKMVQQLLSFNEKPTSLDATDALAVAVCHYFQYKKPDSVAGKSSVKSWEAYIKQHPGKLRSVNR
ncbi:MAG: crossover junction endodeoxyribonuclease RuvC, partial [Ferruginibacter sp.]